MDAATPFAQVPSTSKPIIAQICRQLQVDPFVKSRLSDTDLDRLADAAVREPSDCPVKTFVPILTLHSVREQLTVAVAPAAPRDPDDRLPI